MGSFSIWHWLIVLLIIVLVFGTKKLRNIGQDLGGAVKGFREGMKDAHGESQSDKPGEIPSPAGQTTQTGQTIEGEARREKV